ncbi:MAG: hypothetical protein ACR2PZ_24610 [Pseudomonadales bacterium]
MSELRAGFNRRRFVTQGAAAAFAGSAVPWAMASRPSAGKGHPHHSLNQPKPMPSPIPGTIPTGLPAGHPLEFVHWFLPGPTSAFTPVLGLQGMGVNVEPSTITDYKGFTAFAVLAGEAKGNDGNNYAVEFDLRIMEGRYRAADGTQHHGAFGFF